MEKLDLTIRAKAYVQMNKDAEDVLRIIDEYGGVFHLMTKLHRRLSNAKLT